jgi:hypothetical protein
MESPSAMLLTTLSLVAMALLIVAAGPQGEDSYACAATVVGREK